MAKGCIPCLAPEVKQAISTTLKDKDIDILLDAIADCTNGVAIEMCGKKKRPQSKYQQFVGPCMKKGGTIKSCAAEWQKTK